MRLPAQAALHDLDVAASRLLLADAGLQAARRLQALHHPRDRRSPRLEISAVGVHIEGTIIFHPDGHSEWSGRRLGEGRVATRRAGHFSQCGCRATAKTFTAAALPSNATSPSDCVGTLLPSAR